MGREAKAEEVMLHQVVLRRGLKWDPKQLESDATTLRGKAHYAALAQVFQGLWRGVQLHHLPWWNTVDIALVPRPEAEATRPVETVEKTCLTTRCLAR